MNITKENLYSEILPNLFISGTLDHDVVENPMNYTVLMGPSPFDSVVTMYGHARPFGYYVWEQRFGIADAEIDPLSVPEILQLADWLHSEWKMGKKVAARCPRLDGINLASLLAWCCLKRVTAQRKQFP